MEEINRKPPKYTDSEMFEFMKKFLKENDQLPTVQVIADNFNVYPNAVMERLLRLEREGRLVRNAVNKLMFPKRKRRSV